MEKRKVMLKGFGWCAMCLVIALMAIPVCAGTILYDDFIGTAGSSPDAGKWSATAGITLDGAGNAVFTIPPTQNLNALPSFAYLPVAGDAGRLTIQPTDHQQAPNQILGLSQVGDFVGGTELGVRSDTRSGGAFWDVYIAAGGNYGFFATTAPSWDHSGTWQIDWSLNNVKIYYNDVLAFDSSVNLPMAGGDINAWHIPQVAMRPTFVMYGGASTDALDSVMWESVPEPMTMALLGLGGILTMRKRK